jgi:hypothetical protein
MPDLIIGEHDANGFSLHEGQTLASIYNYTQITGEPPLEREIQDYRTTSILTQPQCIS